MGALYYDVAENLGSEFTQNKVTIKFVAFISSHGGSWGGGGGRGTPLNVEALRRFFLQCRVGSLFRF